MRDVIRRNWRWWVTLTEALVLTAFFAHYIGHRQTLADQRNERQRTAICAILANIPGHIPPEIARARGVFARHGHPNDCQPIPRAAPKATPTSTPHPTVTVTIRPTPIAAASPPPSRSTTPRPRPSPTRATPKPSPSPSRTCIAIVCIRGGT